MNEQEKFAFLMAVLNAVSSMIHFAGPAASITPKVKICPTEKTVKKLHDGAYDHVGYQETGTGDCYYISPFPVGMN